ncbi:MAG: peptidase DmpA [Gemmatimonadetes bacterium]|jgi:L-aminopeptidase/D-esterase-like protein|nr:peptidase DmpA [Gemmatimonadota bacterium]
MSISFAGCGVAVGHATDAAGATGCTVVRGIEGPLRCGVHVVGRATGTRELALLEPGHLVDGRIDALLLAGGSAYGLDAAAGVMRWMEERGRGFDVGAGVVPIVPAAVLFDLLPLGRFDARPTADMGYEACERATTDASDEGSVGAGTGATVGKLAGASACMKGGLGGGAADAGRVIVRALAVVNALGDVRDGSGRTIAGARDAGGRWLDGAAIMAQGSERAPAFDALAGHNTTLCVVCTNVALDTVQLASVARAASAALFQRIAPAGTRFDGDVVFATAPMHGGIAADAGQVEALAVRALALAIERGVKTAAPGDIFRG